jgi:hypothetical protein
LFLLRATLLCAAWALVVLPWTVRNFAVFNQLVWITTNGGSTFYGANNDIVLHDRAFLGSWVSTTRLPGQSLIDADEAVHDRIAWRLGFAWVRSHWSQMPLLFCYKIGRFIMPAVESPNKNFVVLQSITYLPYGLLIFLGMGACWRTRRTYSSSRWSGQATSLTLWTGDMLDTHGLRRSFREKGEGESDCPGNRGRPWTRRKTSSRNGSGRR